MVSEMLKGCGLSVFESRAISNRTARRTWTIEGVVSVEQ